MPRSNGIQRTTLRAVVVRQAVPLSGEGQSRLVRLLSAGLERHLASLSSPPDLLNSAPGGVMYGRHPANEVTHD
jgi:hypothetical protein